VTIIQDTNKDTVGQMQNDVNVKAGGTHT